LDTLEPGSELQKHPILDLSFLDLSFGVLDFFVDHWVCLAILGILNKVQNATK
jgi:hypothetical protein